MLRKNVQLNKLNRDELHRYLGYNNTPDHIVRGIIDECEESLTKLIRAAYVWNVFDIEEIYDEDGIYAGIGFNNTELILKGDSIRKHLTGCSRAALLCATLTAETDRLIRQIEIKDMAKALIMDTVASVAIEQIRDRAEQDISKQYKGMYLTFGFGVGYGDLPLEQEHMILDILNAGKHIGLHSNSSHILTPRKSVVCVIGLSTKPIETGKKGCATCNMVANCKYRKQGMACNE